MNEPCEDSIVNKNADGIYNCSYPHKKCLNPLLLRAL